MNRSTRGPRAYRASGIFCLLVWSVTAALGVPPGGVLPDDPNAVPARGGVMQSILAPDGSVLIQGDFTHVNGVARPGLAVLTPNGQVDTNFVPESVALAAQLPPLGGTAILGRLERLTNGTWVNLYRGHTLAYHADGSLNTDYDFLNPGEGEASILLETATALYVTRTTSTGRWVEAYHPVDYQPLPFSSEAEWPAPWVAVVPAAEGKLWVLGREQPDIALPISLIPIPWTLFRVSAAGELDPAFEPITLSGERFYRLRARNQGGFRLVHYQSASYQLWPMPEYQTMVIDLFDADGTLETTRSVHIPRGLPFVEAEEADGSILHTVGGQTGPRLVRLLPTGAHEPGFEVHLSGTSLQLLSDGRIQHDHVHRILPDGTLDPDWAVPELTADPAFAVIGRFADGAVLVRQTNPVADSDSPELFALDQDLNVDDSFLATNVPAGLSYQLSYDAHSVVIALRDVHEYEDGSQTRILRLLRDGSVCANSPRHIPSSGIVLYQPGGDPIPQPYTGSFALFPLPDDAMLISYLPSHMVVPAAVLFRLFPDGSPDPGFSYSGSMQPQLSPFVLADGRFLIHNNLFAANGSFVTSIPFPQYATPLIELADGRLLIRRDDQTQSAQQLTIFDLNDGLDPDFTTHFGEETRIDRVIPVEDGTWIVRGTLHTPTGARLLVRLYADGRLDPTFRPPAPSRTLPWTQGLQTVNRDGDLVEATFVQRTRPARISLFVEQPDRNALMVAGDFTHIGDVPRPGLALLSLDRVTHFSDWIDMFSGDDEVDPGELLEAYAVGVDPSSHSSEQGLRLARFSPHELRLQRNPDASDVVIEMEVSGDLIDWRPATPSDLVIAPDAHGLRLAVPDIADPIFIRARYRIGD